MKPFPHHYEVRLAGGPVGYAQLATAGIPELRVEAPVDFDGPGDAWSPEHLLLASVAACFLLTLRAVARASKVDFAALEMDASGVVERRDGATRFTAITLRPAITVAATADRQAVLRALEKAERNCLVSSSLSTPVHLEPTIVQPEAPAT